ncbi:MAG: cytochrome c family protein [Robiginitomaculum sp.]|nr:MAG: cytochrome c family protein [Robiginitomaculum sp.]
MFRSSLGIFVIFASALVMACGEKATEQPKPIVDVAKPIVAAAKPVAPEAPEIVAAKVEPAQSEIAPAIATIELPASLAGADLAIGKRQFSKCRACHTIKQGQANRVGPNLYGIFGSTAAQNPKFRYSKALQGAEKTWDMETIDTWISNPRQAVPGTSMAFVGIKDDEKRKALLAYLYTETGGQE